ncbi:GumC family protein [Microbulbifer guangxiensis]|uniref:GumC family protein n=1 Tax=Microbulbifer guangxiensis TaxID=2904249 RepID=UPI001F478D78|nr:polysaccharide biosynthesis tyrosine autokinase [Microbulbifer guangxiensis]
MNKKNPFEGEDLVDESGPDLRRYWQAILSRKWMIAGLTAAITAVAFLVVAGMPSRYQATATLMFELDQGNLVSVEELYDMGTQRREYILTQTELLQSRDLAERVIRKLDLLNHEEFDPTLREASGGLLGWLPFVGNNQSADSVARSRMEQVTSAFLKRLSVSAKRNTHLVDITFTARSPELAADVANAIGAEYIASQSEARAQFTNRASSWLNERLDTLRVKLEQSEAELLAFREQEDLVDMSGVLSLAEQDLNEATTQLQEMRRELRQVGSIHEQVQALEGNELALANLPEVLNNPMIQEIKRNEAQASRNVAELSRRYGPKHPMMIAANNELTMVRDQLRSEVRNLADAIDSRYQTAQARVRAQEQEVARAKENYQQVSRKAVRHGELQQQAQINRQLFNTFLTRVNETREASGFDIAPARLADPAIAPTQPSEPNKRVILSAVLALALMLSVGLAFVLDFLRVGVRNPEDVEVYLHQRLMGLLPDVQKVSGQRLDLRAFFDSDQYTFAESVRTLRTGIVLSHFGVKEGKEAQGQVLAVTSSVPGEGKTTVAENLAFALGQVEKVLLVDADLRKPVVGIDFGVDREKPGLTDMIEGTAPIDDCIHHDEHGGIDVIPAGRLCDDPQKLLVSPRFDEMIKVLARSYDRVIIDTPPVQAVSDALIIARSANSVLFVVKHDDVNKRVVIKGLTRLQQSGAAVAGVVLNHVDTTKSAVYSEEYYGYDYGREPGRKEERQVPSVELAEASESTEEKA